jgi:DNA-binding transcriptional regulator YiaG
VTPRELVEFRNRMGLTQAECAEALGCSLRSIGKWEKPGAKVPKYIALAASAHAHGLPAAGSKRT